MSSSKYKRIMLKLSGEALSGEKGFGFDFDVTQRIAKEIKEIVDMGIEVGAVVGGGNIWRGRNGEEMDRTTDRKSTRLNSSHANISYAVFCLKKKKKKQIEN